MIFFHEMIIETFFHLMFLKVVFAGFVFIFILENNNNRSPDSRYSCDIYKFQFENFSILAYNHS